MTTGSDAASRTYGFVGTGEIAAAIVEGLSSGGSEPPAIVLSPRGREVGRELASRFANVRVCDSNQAVLDESSAIVVGLRWPVTEEVLDELSFRHDHVVLSAVAGASLDQLRAWVAPAREVVRTIPLPQAARGCSMTAMYPDDAVARELFGRVGEVVVAESEAALSAFSAATATFAAHLDYVATVAGWLAEHGAGEQAANAYVSYVFGQVGRSLLDGGDDGLATLREKHTTPGGINEQLMGDLREEGMPDAVRRALDRILDRVRERQ